MLVGIACIRTYVDVKIQVLIVLLDAWKTSIFLFLSICGNLRLKLFLFLSINNGIDGHGLYLPSIWHVLI